jgi:hypothetical protein
MQVLAGGIVYLVFTRQGWILDSRGPLALEVFLIIEKEKIIIINGGASNFYTFNADKPDYVIDVM